MARLDLAARNRFLTVLGNGHGIETAARFAGVSRNALYVRRRRDRHFALSWDAMRARAEALRMADIASRPRASETLDGVRRDARYAGETIGTHVQQQSHRLNRLLTRLDRFVGQDQGSVGNARANPQDCVIFSGVYHHPV